MPRFKTIFGKKRNIVIGAIHLPPLLGYNDFPGIDRALKNALYDLEILEEGGVDAVIFENNYDIPHRASVDASVVACMTYIGSTLRQKTRLPLGISVLWNDYRTALSIAKVVDLQFARVPVFVDTVKTSYGVMEGTPDDVNAFRESIDANTIGILTDIHVKHAELISKNGIVESARLAIEHRSDGLIVTGNWTGDAPDIEELELLKKEIGGFPLIIGSGANNDNISKLFEYSDAAIVSTSLKEGTINKEEINLKSYDQRIDLLKVKEFVAASTKK